MTKEKINDIDAIETQEWVDAFLNIIKEDGIERAEEILQSLLGVASRQGTHLKSALETPYCNTISPKEETKHPGDLGLEQRIRALIRWNAAAMVVRGAQRNPDLGGHIGTFASSASLYDVGFNHFWRANTKEQRGDMIFIQGHSAPGIYARSFLEGRLTEQQLDNFRQEVSGKGLSSYPHPWLMPDYWQFPTVSMGLGPLQAIYQARFMRYLENRALMPPTDRKIWCFCGDGEMDEPESVGALTLPAREQLDNLIFVVNCNLQRLDGPVRGNGKIIQELEALFKGAGWNVIKVIWGQSWDPLFEQDVDGLMQKRMNEALDGDYQNYKAHSGAYTREHFFGAYPELKQRVANLSDQDIWHLKRGGHDPQKIYAAYHRAVHHKGQPTVVLAKTIKGYGLGSAGEALNTAHNTKKMAKAQLMAFRDRFNIPIPDDQVEKAPFYRPADDSPEIKYLKAKRQALGGALPARQSKSTETLKVPELSVFDAILKGSGDRAISTTMAFVRIITTLCKDKTIGKRIVPIIPDEARTFGMEGLFRQLGIYSAVGQKYTPVDSEQVMFYKEAKQGQILEEGINEAGSFASWLAAATAYSTHDLTMIPFYIYYSMFGFQRIGDLAYAAGDSRARGFLIGATSGRTTLNGEGLQHEDGHSHILANTIPNCKTYDPTFGYELAVIISAGLKEMIEEQKDHFYYITTMNENYEHPEIPKGVESGILKGLYPFKTSQPNQSSKKHVQLLGSGAILREVIAASELLKKEFGISSEIWSATSFNELARDGLDCVRYNRLNPTKKLKIPYITQCLKDRQGPVIAATDYMKNYAEQVRQFVPGKYHVLGTDGFGRSDSRENLRQFFEVDRYYIVVTALWALVDEQIIESQVLMDAMKKYKITPNKANPMIV